MRNKYYCYTGDVKKLIPNGWKFQKLYARNYKTYRKDEIIMCVVSKMCLEFNNIRAKYQTKVVEFIFEHLNEPETFWMQPSLHFKDTMLPTWVLQEGEIITGREAILNKCNWHLAWEKDNNIPYLEDGERICLSCVNTVKELVELGGVELREF